MKISSVFEKGFINIKEEEDRLEKEKIGMFRGGSTGAYDSDRGVFYGTCPRKAILRYLGINEKRSMDDHLLFNAGKSHELCVLRLLCANENVKEIQVFEKDLTIKEYSDKIVVLKEALNIEITEDLFVSGRPDFIVTMKDGYQFAIETKATVSKDKTAKSFEYPLVYAICQASLYKLMLNMDYYLVYGNYSVYNEFKFWKAGNRKIKKNLGAIYKEFAKGYTEKFVPKLTSYGVVFEGKKISIIREDDNSIIETFLTTDMVADYYIALKEFIRLNDLPPRKEEIELYGQPDYSECQYCPLKNVCDSYDSNLISFDRYLKEAEFAYKNKK